MVSASLNVRMKVKPKLDPGAAIVSQLPQPISNV